MVELESPLGEAYRTGTFGDFADGTGVSLSEVQPGSIVQVAAFGASRAAVRETIARTVALILDDRAGAGAISPEARAFGTAPGRWLVVAEAEDLAGRLRGAVASDLGSVTDLTHGRTVIRIDGPKAEWVLSKLFAIDFDPKAFPVGSGCTTTHHDINAQIQRVAPDAFELVVFRSFARSFWTILGHAAEEVGYAVR